MLLTCPWLSAPQGSRVWLRHKELLLPSTVNSCDEISLVVTTDYGKVSRSTPKLLTQR